MNRFSAGSPSGSLVCALSILVVFLLLVSAHAPSQLHRFDSRMHPPQGWSLSNLEEAYFLFNYPPYPQTFVIRLNDPEKIQEARDILSGQQPNRHIMGTIVKTPAGYNPPWSYHLDSTSISFFDFATEVCDATIQYVEQHLDEACGAFLPGCVWCPLDSRLLVEVPTPLSFSVYLPAILH